MSRTAVLTMAAVMFLAGTSAGQQIPTPFPQFPDARTKTRRPDVGNADSDVDANALAKRMRMLNSERQKEIVSDTAKLLKLAREFNEEIAQSGVTSLTEAQLRRLAEIAKLAKNVRERMTYTLGSYPPPEDPPGLFR